MTDTPDRCDHEFNYCAGTETHVFAPEDFAAWRKEALGKAEVTVSRHFHAMGDWRCGETYYSGFFLLERTRMIRTCVGCGKAQVSSIRGWWRNDEDGGIR